MKNATLNLRDLVILVADPSPYMCMLANSMLRGFGANKAMDARSSIDAIQILTEQKIDILLCDNLLPPHGGLKLTQAIRRNVTNPNRTVPILIMTSDTRESTIKSARDAGANMVVAKPMSPSSLYDRLSWIAFNPRNVRSRRQRHGKTKIALHQNHVYDIEGAMLNPAIAKHF